jgi:cyclophilin family peptidyl-prolyl cis-trans isomerase
MKTIQRLAIAGIMAIMASGASLAQSPASRDDTLVIDTRHGAITIRLRPDLAPKHVERIKVLVRRGFYDGIVFHRVIDGFMAQTGDPTGTGMGRSDLPNLAAEFTSTPYRVGSLGMARGPSPDSANSQFFICFEGCGSLTGQYTLFGEVTNGMEAVRKIKKGSSADNGKVTDPDKMTKVRVGADVK